MFSAEIFSQHAAGLPSSVDSTSDCRSGDSKLDLQLGQVTFVKIDHEIISMYILPFH